MGQQAIRFSQTRVGTWRRCRQRYEWKYVDRIPETASDGQKRGRCGHKALELWYRGVEDSACIMAGLLEIADQPKDVERMRTILTRYFKWASLMDAQEWSEVLGTEVELTGEIDGQQVMGIADLIVRHKTGGLAIVDHKFSANGTLEGALQSPQLSMYGELALQTLGEMPDYLIYNTVRTTVGGQAVTNPVLRYKAQIVPERHQLWKDEFGAQMGEIVAFHKGGAEAPRKYRNQTRDCSWDCPFYGRCLALDRGEEYVEAPAGVRDDLVLEDDVTQG